VVDLWVAAWFCGGGGAIVCLRLWLIGSGFQAIRASAQAHANDDEVRNLVDQAYRRCKQTLVENRVVLDKLAAILMEKETVDAEELQELLARNDVKMASIA
jgi:ATP-dependent Zn protease